MPLSSCVRTTDIRYIKSVLTHPLIWPDIKGDAEWTADEFEPPMTDDIAYLKCFGGLFILHPYGDGLQIHANMIYRGQAAIDAATSAIQWAKDQGCKALYATVPRKFPNVKQFAELMGLHEYKFENDKHYLTLGLI